MRIKLKKGRQKEIILLAKGEDSWIKLAKLLKINPIYLSNELANEKRLLSEETYNNLCNISGKNFNEEIIEKLDDNWGRAKGGLASPKNKKKFISPKLNPELAEVFGIILGDGHLSEYAQGKKVRVYCVRIAGNSLSDKDYIKEYIPKLFSRVFREKGAIIQSKKSNCAYYTLYGKEMVEFLKKNGLKTGNKVKNNIGIPDWIKKDKDLLRRCIRGLIDTDGCIYYISKKTNRNIRITFTNHAYRLLNDCREGLLKLGFSPSKIIRGYDICLSKKKDIEKYIKEVGFSNSKNLKRAKFFRKHR